jgi:uncharacterized membrane protein
MVIAMFNNGGMHNKYYNIGRIITCNFVEILKFGEDIFMGTNLQLVFLASIAVFHFPI